MSSAIPTLQMLQSLFFNLFLPQGMVGWTYPRSELLYNLSKMLACLFWQQILLGKRYLSIVASIGLLLQGMCFKVTGYRNETTSGFMCDKDGKTRMSSVDKLRLVVLLMVQKSCISWYDKHLIVYRVWYISTGAWFLPPTLVCPYFFLHPAGVGLKRYQQHQSRGHYLNIFVGGCNLVFPFSSAATMGRSKHSIAKAAEKENKPSGDTGLVLRWGYILHKSFYRNDLVIRLMEEILHHLGCIQPCK